jgi:maltooligosyltrehalose trehalohydrolase
LVDACHRQGLAVILDVVYNHLGPEGNVLYECGPYEQEKYHTPWGAALNFDGPDSEEVRRYFLQSIWQWLIEYRIDGLRLDAVQMICDSSPIPFLEEVSRLKSEAEKLRKRPLFLIAETDMNDSRLLRPRSQNGMGFDAQWADDLHHNLHVLLTGERRGYYADYGSLEQLARIYRDGVAFTGQYSPYRKRRHGRPYDGIDKKSLIVELQNHDQVGNRMLGDRLGAQIGFEKLKLGAACVLLSPFTPFLFMGEEFFCQTPFLFFVNYSDNKLIDAMRASRKKEWKDFGWDQEPPNPADIQTFEKCILPERNFIPNSREAIMTAYYAKLISLSKELRMMVLQKAFLHEECVVLQYGGEDNVLVILSFETDHKAYRLSPSREWEILLQSESFQASGKSGADGEIRIPPFSASVMRGKKDALSPQHMSPLPLLSTATGEPVVGGD